MLLRAPLSSGARDTSPSSVLEHQLTGSCTAAKQGKACPCPLHSDSV